VGNVWVDVHLQDGVSVAFYPDGTHIVNLSGMRAARHELWGEICFNGDEDVAWHQVEDAYVTTPLKEHVIRAACRAAVRRARYARRVGRQIIRATGPVHRHEPGTLEHLVLLQAGRIREDGWPVGHIPL